MWSCAGIEAEIFLSAQQDQKEALSYPLSMNCLVLV